MTYFALFQVCSRQKLVHITKVCWIEVTYLRIDVTWLGQIVSPLDSHELLIQPLPQSEVKTCS